MQLKEAGLPGPPLFCLAPDTVEWLEPRHQRLGTGMPDTFDLRRCKAQWDGVLS
jgi:LPS sulfotransferase NodH